MDKSAVRNFICTKLMAFAGKKSSGNATWIRNMKKSKNTFSQFAICLNNSEYPVSLDLHKVYPVLSDEQAEKDGFLRVIDESGEDYLFPSAYFMVIVLPSNCVRTLKKSFTNSLARRSG